MQSRKISRKLSLTLLLFSLVSSVRLFAEEKYYITETQLTNLETTIKNQKLQISNLQNQLISASTQQTKLQNQIQTQAELLKQSENRNLKNKFEIGGVCFSIGVTSGVVATIILINKLGS